MEKERIEAILNYIGEDEVNEIEIQDENTITIDSEEYKVLTDEEADEEFKEYQESLFDDLGLESFTEWARDYIINNFVDTDWFDEAMRESYDSYIGDIREEGDRLQEEMEEAEAETEEEFLNYLCEQEEGKEWYKNNFGIEEFSKVVKDNNLVNIDDTIEWLKGIDGRVCLASYDGEEGEQDNYYIYRTN